MFATGVTIVTAVAPDGSPAGMTVNSFTSVSADPPQVLVCVDRRSRMHDLFRDGASFAVNVLSESQREVSARFASPVEDRFAGIGWKAGETGAPLLPETLALFECAVRQAVAAGDHTIVVGEVVRLDSAPGRPLLFFGSGYRSLGN
jgi:flavin reductase (DIM6/NTAB) family NADH-FMN oxidoreductase RutF